MFEIDGSNRFGDGSVAFDGHTLVIGDHRATVEGVVGQGAAHAYRLRGLQGRRDDAG